MMGQFRLGISHEPIKKCCDIRTLYLARRHHCMGAGFPCTGKAMNDPEPGDEVLIHGILIDVSKDAWGPDRGNLYQVRVSTADSGSQDVFASWIEPAVTIENAKTAYETGFAAAHRIAEKRLEHAEGLEELREAGLAVWNAILAGGPDWMRNRDAALYVMFEILAVKLENNDPANMGPPAPGQKLTPAQADKLPRRERFG